MSNPGIEKKRGIYICGHISFFVLSLENIVTLTFSRCCCSFDSHLDMHLKRSSETSVYGYEGNDVAVA